jgi:hypothetical protein
VVHDGQVIRVIEGTMSTAGTVIGIDEGTDVALVQTAVPLSGRELGFSATDPTVGDQVAALGFPRGEPLAFIPGTINGLDRKADIEGFPRHDLLEMDAATLPGNSGGPVIRSDGSVVGLVDAHGLDPSSGTADQGRRFAVSSATAEPLIVAWRHRAAPISQSGCSGATYDDGSPVAAEDFPSTARMQATRTLDLYFAAVNGGDFATALAQLTTPSALEDFQANVASTVDEDIVYRAIEPSGDGLIAWVTFTSHQDPGKGPAGSPQETCTRWSLSYWMAKANGLWLIDATRPHDGEGHTPCVTTAPSTVSPSTGSTKPPGSTAPPS